MDGEEHVCPACGRSVAEVVRRYKTLGVWVPVWGPGPCRNPECRDFARPARQHRTGRGRGKGVRVP
ncbi:hypothetical protein SLH32_35090 [Streptomyces sp. KHY 26]|nr:hypothetical protein [Streptomyces hygroscopicus]